MPLQIVNKDITTIACDAMVNSTNTKLCPGGHGVDASIHRAAGPELYKECRKIGGIKIGEAVYTKAYELPCKYVIHIAGPKWQGGKNNEVEKLQECYRNVLTVAKQLECEKIALPLISSGALGVPKDKVLEIAFAEIKEFLETSDIDVVLAISDKSSYKIDTRLSNDLGKYIRSNLVVHRNVPRGVRRKECEAKAMLREAPVYDLRSEENACLENRKEFDIDSIIEDLDESFSKRLFMLIDSKGMTDVECYKKANVSRQTWHKIISDSKYRPSKNTVISLAIALKLSYEQTDSLLATVGYTLSDSIVFDLIIKYFLIHEKYDIFEIDATLLKYDQVTLGSCM